MIPNKHLLAKSLLIISLIFPVLNFGQATVYAHNQTESVSVDASLQTGDMPAPLTRISEKLRSGQIFTAEMDHTFEDEFTGEVMRNTGVVWVTRDQYKVIAAGQEISVDGETSIVWNEGQHKVIISPYFPEDDDFAPSRFLSDSERSYEVTNSETTGEGNTLVSLEAIDPFEVIVSVQILINPDTLIPLEIRATDQTGNRYHTVFQDGSYLEPDESIFEITWPESAEIIDLRE